MPDLTRSGQSNSPFFAYATGYEPSDDFSTTLSLRSSYFIRNGTTNPNRLAFARANGYMPVTAYNGEFQRTSFSLGSSTVSRPKTGGGTQTRNVVDTYDCFVNGAPPSLSHATMVNCSQGALKNLNSKLRSQSMSLVETLAEGRKTRNMIMSTVSSLTTGLSQIRRGNFVGAAKTFNLGSPPAGVSKKNSLSGNWLAYRYGWMPLYLTVYGAMEWYYNIGKTRQPVIHLAGNSNCSWSEPTTESFGGAGYGNSSGNTFVHFQFKRKRTEVIKGSVELGAYFRISNPTVLAATGLGLTNPLLVAWELVPLSFVADWFVNVSDVLEQLDAWTGKQFLVGYKSMKATSTVSMSAYATNADLTPYKLLGFIPPTCKSETTTFARYVLPTPAIVELQLQAELTPKRFIDAIALMQQRFR